MATVTPGALAAAYAHNAGFSGNDLIIAVAIAYAESGCQMVRGGPNDNGTYDWGIWQINDVNKPSMSTRNSPVANARAAHVLYKNRGNNFTDWSTFKDGTYRKHMQEARGAVMQLQTNGPAWERSVVANAPMLPDSKDHPLDTAIIDGVQNLANPAGKIAEFAGKLFGNFTAFVLALVLFILGIVILLRKPIGSVAGALPAGKAATAAGSAVRAPRTPAAPKVVRTAADRAADSVAFADAKKKILAERTVPAPKSDASADFVAKLKAQQAARRISQGINPNYRG